MFTSHESNMRSLLRMPALYPHIYWGAPNDCNLRVLTTR